MPPPKNHKPEHYARITFHGPDGKIWKQMEEEEEQKQERKRTPIMEPYAHPEDQNIQIYTVRGRGRGGYLEMQYLEPPPENAKQNQRKPQTVNIPVKT